MACCEKLTSAERIEKIQRLRCPEYLTVSWVEIPPYIYNTSEGTVGGVFHSILTQMVQFCCPSQTNLSFAENPATRSMFQSILANGTDDILLPVYGTGKKKDRLGEPFISLVDSPGIAYFYGPTVSAQEALMQAFSTSWPVLVVVLLFALVIGSGFWVVEVIRGSSKLQRTKEKNCLKDCVFHTMEGPWNGFYWAIVTLTTVGYGDMSPKTILGRIMAMIWILFGTVMLSMFTASITTGLITACLSNDITLAGKKVAVMSHSKESGIAVKKNAIAINYETIKELSHVLERGEADGLLLDSFIAGHYQDLFVKFLLADVIEYVFSYGMILRNKGVRMNSCFRIYLDMYKDKLFLDVSKAVKPFKPLKFGNQASTKSSTLIDWSSKSLQHILMGIGGLLAVLVISGMVMERFLKKSKMLPELSITENGSECEAHHTRLKNRKEQHIQERSAIFSELKSDLGGLSTNIQGFISYTKEMQRLNIDETNAVGGKL